MLFNKKTRDTKKSEFAKATTQTHLKTKQILISFPVLFVQRCHFICQFVCVYGNRVMQYHIEKECEKKFEISKP